MMIDAFDTGMIERYLHSRGWRFFRDQDGNFLVLINTGTRQLQVHLAADGPRRDLLVVWVSTSEVYAGVARAKLLEQVNQWNRETHWPKASLREGADGESVWVVGENCYPLMDGIHSALFATLADYTIETAATLFERVAEAVEIPSAQTLEAWFRTTG
ncbi:YbjN domain-containing protein [Rhodococcus aetherivorans]